MSSPISPSGEAAASGKNQKTSMAAGVQKIVQATTGVFTVDEITKALVISSRISPGTTTPDEWQNLKKLVSNKLGRQFKEGELRRVNGKNGIYCRADLPPNVEQINAGTEGTIKGTEQSDFHSHKERWQTFREANRMRPPENPGQPLSICWPLALEREFRVYPKNPVVIGAVTNAGKTTFALNLALMNMNQHRVTYINSEMSEEELAGKLQDFGQAYGIPWTTLYEKVFFTYCNCNALDSNDIKRLLDLMDPNGINVIDYIKIHDKFFTVGQPLEKIHSRLDQGIAVVFFQKDPYVDHLMGKSFPEHLARVAMMIDIDQVTQLRLLKFTKVKFPAHKGDRPEKHKIWFSVKDGVVLERTKPPIKKNKSKETGDSATQYDQVPDQSRQPQAEGCAIEVPQDPLQWQ